MERILEVGFTLGLFAWDASYRMRDRARQAVALGSTYLFAAEHAAARLSGRPKPYPRSREHWQETLSDDAPSSEPAADSDSRRAA